MAEGAASHGLIIHLIIQTIRQGRSRSDQIDEASDVSRPDPSGADQIDAKHQATDLAVGGSNPSRRAPAQPYANLPPRIVVSPGPTGNPTQMLVPLGKKFPRSLVSVPCMRLRVMVPV